WISYPIFPAEIYSDASWIFAELESALFHTFGLLSPIFVALIAFSFLYKWFILDILRGLYNFFRDRQILGVRMALSKMPFVNENTADDNDSDLVVDRRESPLVVKQTHERTRSKPKMLHRAILLGAIIIAPLLIIYPHLPTVNPGGGVSTDEQYYVSWLSELRLNEQLGGLQVLADAFVINEGDRPITLLLIMGIANLTGLPDIMVVRYLPVALAPALVVASYMLVSRTLAPKQNGEMPRNFAAIAALITAFSPQIIVGEYAGLLANWLALVVGYFVLYFMINCWDSSDKQKIVFNSASLLAVLLLTMLIHLYTWSHLLVVTLVFCGLSYLFSRSKESSSKLKVLIMVVILATSLAVDYGRSLYLATPPLAGSELSKSIDLVRQPVLGWDQLYFTLATYVGGFLSNPALFLLALVWLVAKAELTKGLDRVLIALLFIIALPILVGTVEFQSRVLHNTPIQIPAILALYSFSMQSKYRTTRVLLIVAVIAVTATFALRGLANLYLGLPEGFVLDKQFLLP
ncbi:MAG: hypothetical protein ACREBU_03855, partial [Nitrososphaera sp.]